MQLVISFMKTCTLRNLTLYKSIFDDFEPKIAQQDGFDTGNIKIECNDDAYCNQSLYVISKGSDKYVAGICFYQKINGDDSDCAQGQYTPYLYDISRTITFNFDQSESYPVSIPTSLNAFYCKGDYSTEPEEIEPIVIVEVPEQLSMNVIIGIMFAIVFFLIALGTVLVVAMFVTKKRKYKKVILARKLNQNTPIEDQSQNFSSNISVIKEILPQFDENEVLQ
uniref:Transmembrane protein n=1 Tax=Trepomonas sp. PC1 TaxID=1076344 RepID=A0A146K1F3_9EUKA|eukprot:JAP89654.1 Hypothetical protein TPC1_30851 [Trepomonas sp. PC1]